MKRFAISLPDHQAKAVERIRRFRNVPRSRIIQEAIDRYLAEDAAREAIRRYIEGYRRLPESEGDADGYARAGAEVVGSEDWS